MVRNILTIIEKAHNIELIIKVVLSDMGTQNRSWWRLDFLILQLVNYSDKKLHLTCNNEDKLFITADSVHVFKNVACALTLQVTHFI